MTLIRNARKEAGLTQQQLSNMYSIPLRTIQDWESGKRTPPDYVIHLLIRCLSADVPANQTQVLSEPEQVSSNKQAYIFYTAYGKPLSKELAQLAHQEMIANRVQLIPEENEEGELIENKQGKLYLCTAPDLERGVPLGFEFRASRRTD